MNGCIDRSRRRNGPQPGPRDRPVRGLASAVLRAAAALVVPALFCSCATTDLVTGRRTNNLYEIRDDIQIGRAGMKDFLREMKSDGAKVVRDPARAGRVEAMLRHIAEANRLTNFPYRVTVFETEEVNAMALPGGEIVAFTGLWDPDEGMVEDADELAAILAHEIAHVECRHSTEAMTREMPMDLLLGGVGLFAELSEDEDLMDIASAAFVVYEGLVLPKYSRVDELEADRVGLLYMARAGYDPRAALRVWKRLDEVEGSEWAPLSIFSTHPPHSRRYEELDSLLPAALEEFRRAREILGPPPGVLPGGRGGRRPAGGGSGKR